MFTHLSELFSTLFRLVPRLRVIPETHGGVAFVRGRARLVKSGCLYFFWPIWTELLVVPVVRQTLNLPNQVLVPYETDRPHVLSGVVVYDIGDPVKALSRVHDIDDAIRDMALVTIRQVVAGKKKEDLWWRPEEINEELLKAMKKQLWGWGVRVQQVFLSDIAPCTVIRTVGDTTVVPLEETAEEE